MPSYFYVQRYVENGFLIYLLVEIRLRVFSLVLVLTGVCQGGGINNNLVDSLPFKDSPRNRGGASGAATGASGSLNFSRDPNLVTCMHVFVLVVVPVYDGFL
jgi:hypothetical protein